MTSRLRKFTLTMHITFSVGWLGAVVCFLVLSIVGVKSSETANQQGIYFATKMLAWFVIAPFAFAALLTGIVQSLVTEWGLIRYYWVLTKLFLTAFSTVILLLKLDLINRIASVVTTSTMLAANIRDGRMELLVHAGGGLLVLLVITTVSVFKPWGRTGYGRNKINQKLSPDQSLSIPKLYSRLSVRPIISFIVITALATGFVLLHLGQGVLGTHGH